MPFSLAGLTDPALEAAANKGLLRRAHRDVAAGLVAVLAGGDSGAELRVDGETVRLGVGGLGAATCTCPAHGVCRHILAAVIALRDGTAPPDPAPVDAPPDAPAPDAVAEIVALPLAALTKAFGRAAMVRAEALLAAAGPVTVEQAPGGCVVHIPGHPGAHYLAGLGPGGMVSKGQDRPALQAAALLAVRRLRAGEPVAPAGLSPVPSAPTRPAELAFLDGVAAALRYAARAALAHAPVALQQHLLDLAVSSRAAALPHLAGGLRAVAADMAGRRARAASFDAGEALATIARCYALAEALRRNGDDPGLRGAAGDGSTPLPVLELIGCGVQNWTRGGARGVTAHLLAPDAAGGPRWFQVSLARAAGQDLTFNPVHAATHEPLWGGTLDALGRSAFRLEGASTTADGTIAPVRTARATVDGTTWTRAIGQHDGQVVSDWHVLSDQLHRSFVPSLRRVRPPVRPVVLAPTTLGLAQFDALAQVAWIPAADGAGRWLRLQFGEAADTDTQLDALAAAMSGPTPPVLVALARPDGAALVLELIAAARTDGALDYLQRPLPRPRAVAATGLLARLRRGLDTLGRGTGTAQTGPRFEAVPRPSEATDRILAAAADESLALAELGGRMDDPARLTRLRTLADRMEAAGLPVLAHPLRLLAGSATAERPHHLLVFTHALACFRQLGMTLPLVRRADVAAHELA